MTAAVFPAKRDAAGGHVFISYARGDAKRVRTIVAAIEAAGYPVWWDAMLQGGEQYSGLIAAAIERAFAVVVVWSELAVASNWVRDEAQAGNERGCLVPVSLDGVQPPLGFRQFHTIDLARSSEAGVEQMLAALAALHGQPARPARPAAAAMPRIGRRGLLAGAGLLAVGGGIAAVRLLPPSGPAADAHSIAVLTFQNMSDDPAKAYFSDGITAEIRAELAHVPRLHVAAQTSSEAATRNRQDARSTAKALNVAYLLDGNVRRAADRVRVSAELIEGRSGFTAWSETFDRPVLDVFAVQSEIAAQVTAALSRRVLGEPLAPAAASRGATTNLVAYDAYLRGRYLFDQAAGEASDRAALAEYDAAIAADPGYALAHAARSRALAVIGNQYSQGLARRAVYDQAIIAARRAVALAPDNAAGHSALGFALFNGHLDPVGAKPSFDRSLALGGGDADILSRYAVFSIRLGNFALARSVLDRAAALDPLNARILWQRADVELCDGHYPQAASLAAAAIKLNPKISVAHAVMGAAQLLNGDLAAADAAYAAEPNSLFALTGLAIVRRREGRLADAAQALAELESRHGDNGLYQQAQVYAQWGEASTAMDRLARGRIAGDAGLMYARSDPLLAPLRGRQDFVALLKALKFG